MPSNIAMKANEVDDIRKLEQRFKVTTDALRRMTTESELQPEEAELRRIDHNGILDTTISSLRQNMKSLAFQVESQAEALRQAQAQNRVGYGRQGSSLELEGMLDKQVSNSEILSKTKILKADIRILDSHVFKNIIDHDMQLRIRGITSFTDRQEYLDSEWQRRTVDLERKIASPSVLDVAHLSTLIGIKQNLVFLTIEHMLRQKKGLDTLLGRESDAAAELLQVGSTVPPTKSTHSTPSSETTGFLDFCNGITDLFATFRALAPDGGTADITKSSATNERLQKAHEEAQKELRTLGALHTSLEREHNLLTSGGNSDGGGAQVILLKQRTQIDELRTSLARMKDDVSGVRRENADLRRENGSLKDTVARLNLNFGEEKRKDTEMLSNMAPRLRDLEVNASKQLTVLKQAIIDMDFMGTLAKNYANQIEHLQKTIDSFSQDRAEQKRMVKFAKTSEQALAQKCEEKERIARVAITARREATEHYRKVKRDLEALWKELDETKEELKVEKDLHHHDLELERHRFENMVTEFEAREQVNEHEAKNRKAAIEKLQEELSENKEAMGEVSSLKAKIAESVVVIEELEMKNKDLMEQIYELRVAGAGVMEMFAGEGGNDPELDLSRGQTNLEGEDALYGGRVRGESFEREINGAMDDISISPSSSRTSLANDH